MGKNTLRFLPIRWNGLIINKLFKKINHLALSKVGLSIKTAYSSFLMQIIF